MGDWFSDANIPEPRTAYDDAEWLLEIDDAERAVYRLLLAKRRTLRASPQKEHVLWCRYHERLVKLKRNLDAAVM